MTPWVKLDDSFHGHRKPRRAGHEAVGVWTRALSYCGFYLTDGFVDDEWLEDEVPHRVRRQKLLEKLCEVSMFHRVVEGQGAQVVDRHGEEVWVGPFPTDGYLIHDYLAHNPSREEVEERRKKERQKKAGQRLSPGDTPRESPGESPDLSSRARTRSRPVPVPNPSRRSDVA